MHAYNDKQKKSHVDEFMKKTRSQPGYWFMPGSYDL